MTRGENCDGRSQANAHIARSALTFRSSRHRSEEWSRVTLLLPSLPGRELLINETWSIDKRGDTIARFSANSAKKYGTDMSDSYVYTRDMERTAASLVEGSRYRDFSPVRDSVHALDSRDLAQIGHQVLPETDIDSRRVLFRDGFYVAVK